MSNTSVTFSYDSVAVLEAEGVTETLIVVVSMFVSGIVNTCFGFEPWS